METKLKIIELLKQAEFILFSKHTRLRQAINPNQYVCIEFFPFQNLQNKLQYVLKYMHPQEVPYSIMCGKVPNAVRKGRNGMVKKASKEYNNKRKMLKITGDVLDQSHCIAYT